MSHKTIIGTLAEVLTTLACKYNKRLYLGQIFKYDELKYQVVNLAKLDDGRIVVQLDLLKNKE